MFTLKQLEKIASKEIGIPFQTVKDVLQSLDDDNMVNKAKIGTSVYFWSFPNDQYIKVRHLLNLFCFLKNDFQQDQQTIDSDNEKIAELEKEDKALDEQIEEMIAKENENKEEVQTKKDLIAALSEMEEKKKTLLQQLELYKDFDPENPGKDTTEYDAAVESVERWTSKLNDGKNTFFKFYLFRQRLRFTILFKEKIFYGNR